MLIIGPPNWISWLADVGSVLGFAATLILAFQTWKVKNKYNHLISLVQSLGRLRVYCPELLELIQTYTVTDRATLKYQVAQVIGRTEGDLLSLQKALPAADQSMVQVLLDEINAIKKSMSANTLSILYRDLNALVIQLENIVDSAKIDI